MRYSGHKAVVYKGCCNFFPQDNFPSMQLAQWPPGTVVVQGCGRCGRQRLSIFLCKATWMLSVSEFTTEPFCRLSWLRSGIYVRGAHLRGPSWEMPGSLRVVRLGLSLLCRIGESRGRAAASCGRRRASPAYTLQQLNAGDLRGKLISLYCNHLGGLGWVSNKLPLLMSNERSR